MADILELEKSVNSSERFGFMVGGTAHVVVVDQKRPWVPIGMKALPPAMRLVWGTPSREFLNVLQERLFKKGVEVLEKEDEIGFVMEGYDLGLRYTPDFSEDMVEQLNLPEFLDH